MATTHPSDVRTAFADLVKTRANAGSGGPKLFIGTSSLSLPSTGVIGVITLDDFNNASGPTTTSPSTGNSAEASGGGTAAIAIVTDSDNNETFRGACGVGSGEVQLNSTSFSEGDTITLTADVSWTAPS